MAWKRSHKIRLLTSCRLQHLQTSSHSNSKKMNRSLRDENQIFLALFGNHKGPRERMKYGEVAIGQSNRTGSMWQVFQTA